ncbi:MAG: SGNH/GDSL hydrolase family protein [Actinomycetota bacterium]|nr:MAG: SGNH/GDSL hydrolase family protein [Actinomycetota bacterium]
MSAPDEIIRLVSKVAHARRIAKAAAFGSGGAAGAGAATLGLLVAQARAARRAIGPRSDVAPYQDGRYGPRDGTSVRLAMLGDSSAAGLGVADRDDTIGATLARAVAATLGRGVVLTTVAVVGAQSRHLADQVERILVLRPHIAVIMIGANDVTHAVRPQVSVGQLQQAVRRLREHGTEVVVGTCPDLGTVRPIAQPLRYVARRLSRSLAAAQAIGAVEAGGRAVSLGDLLGPEFDARPETMFSADRFHPSAEGYRAAAQALLPAVLAGIRHGTGADLLPARWSAPLPVAEAAVAAAQLAGAAVEAAQVGGQDRGPRGRWARLRLRGHGGRAAEADEPAVVDLREGGGPGAGAAGSESGGAAGGRSGGTPQRPEALDPLPQDGVDRG